MSGPRSFEYAERSKAVRWAWFSVLGAMASGVLALPFGLPLGHLIGTGFAPESWQAVGDYFGHLVADPSHLGRVYGKWITDILNYHGVVPVALWMPATPVFLGLTVLMTGLLANPYSFLINYHGAGRIAESQDIKSMGLFDGHIVVLGRWKKKLLRMKETLSVLCVAPPGTGKTAGVVIPTILESDGLSLIVNDPKPELARLTSGHRAKLGPVYVLDWAAQDRPEENVFYPRWNPLSPRCIPTEGPQRDLYVDRIVSVLIEDPKGSADPHWTKTGRNALNGLIHFIVSKNEKALLNDYFAWRLEEGTFDEEDALRLMGLYTAMPALEVSDALSALNAGLLAPDTYFPVGTWDGLPEQWYGREACIAMILDWIMESQHKAAAQIKQRMAEGDQNAAFADPMRDMLDEAAEEARNFGYAPRAQLELTQLANTPDKERGSILSTALTGIGIFKNSAVRERTLTSDFGFEDLRGHFNPRANKFEPTTVYVCVNQENQRALGVITGVFVELLSAFLIAHPPNSMSTMGMMGPFPTLFVLDEFPQMPKLAAVKDGPAVGRGQKVSYLLVGQDLGQIEGTYDKPALETIITTTAAKVILPQNNEVTAERFSKMIGNRTVRTESFSRTEGFSKNVNPLASNVSRQLQGIPVISQSKLLSLPPGKQVVLYQNYASRPVLADTPFYFRDKRMVRLTQMRPAPAMPDDLLAHRLEELRERETLAGDWDDALTAADDEDEDATPVSPVSGGDGGGGLAAAHLQSARAGR